MKKKTTSRQTGVVECMRGSKREAVEILRSLMDPSVAESLQALERTAAWVNQVAQMRQMVRVICVLFLNEHLLSWIINSLSLSLSLSLKNI